MKKIHLIFSIIGFLIISCNKQTEIIIEGSLQNGEDKVLMLERLDIDKTTILDSCRIKKKNNNFRFRIHAVNPDLFILRNEEGKIINLLPAPGERLRIEGDYLNFDGPYTVKGSDDSELVRQLVERLNKTKADLKKLDSEINEKAFISPEQTEYFIRRQKEIIKGQRDFSIRFIVGHLKSLSGIYALYQKLGPDQLVLGENRDIQYMKILADSLSLKYPDVPLVNSFVNDARSTEKRYYSISALQDKLNQSRNTMPDIELPGIQGNPVKLSSLKGKVTLLYFWSPQSEVCTRLNEELIQTYLKYRRSGFEIYAIGLSEDPAAWANEVIFEKLSWVNVIERNVKNSDITRMYNVHNIPTTFLLSRAGEILARDLFGNDLRIWLDNLTK
jgi:thiol-disulfide isomerase/thioredoxin